MASKPDNCPNLFAILFIGADEVQERNSGGPRTLLLGDSGISAGFCVKPSGALITYSYGEIDELVVAAWILHNLHQLKHPLATRRHVRLTKQTTIGEDFQVSGVGLHSNSPVSVRVLPAPPYSGYCFRRTDLGNFEIQATPEHVAHVSYATTLMRSGVMIATVEHLLSALVGCGIDNAIIEIDSLEVPILDGSSGPWVELIEQAGIVELPAPRASLRVLKKVEIREDNRWMSLEPDSDFRISCEIDFAHPMIGRQTCEVGLTNGTYASEIAPARTFGFTEELKQLQASGLARGGSLDNAIALTPDGMLNPEPLRFPDEFVRHKILDIIGDLALLGMPIIGRVHAVRSGHGLHTRLLSTLLRDRSAWQVSR